MATTASSEHEEAARLVAEVCLSRAKSSTELLDIVSECENGTKMGQHCDAISSPEVDVLQEYQIDPSLLMLEFFNTTVSTLFEETRGISQELLYYQDLYDENVAVGSAGPMVFYGNDLDFGPSTLFPRYAGLDNVDLSPSQGGLAGMVILHPTGTLAVSAARDDLALAAPTGSLSALQLLAADLNETPVTPDAPTIRTSKTRSTSPPVRMTIDGAWICPLVKPDGSTCDMHVKPYKDSALTTWKNHACDHHWDSQQRFSNVALKVTHWRCTWPGCTSELSTTEGVGRHLAERHCKASRFTCPNCPSSIARGTAFHVDRHRCKSPKSGGQNKENKPGKECDLAATMDGSAKYSDQGQKTTKAGSGKGMGRSGKRKATVEVSTSADQTLSECYDVQQTTNGYTIGHDVENGHPMKRARISSNDGVAIALPSLVSV